MKLSVHHSKPTFHRDEARLFKSIFKSSEVASGRLVRTFEDGFAKFLGLRGAVSANSGTSALHLSLLALGVGRGGEVILPSYVCASLLDAVNYVGARPVLADIDYDTFNISAEDTKRRMTKKTRAVIIPHLFGLPCDIDEFLKLGVPIIEDCAQSLGARYKDGLTGSFGILSVFSFYATKLMTTGYGGMVASNSKRLLEKIRDLNEPDKREDYRVRYNYKMSEIEAALGISQLGDLRYFIKKRKELARAYNNALLGCGLKLPAQKNDREHIFYRYVIKTEGAPAIKKDLEKNGIEVVPPVYRPLHRYLSLDKRSFPNTERIYKEAVSLPIYPALKRSEFLKVVKVLDKAVSI